VLCTVSGETIPRSFFPFPGNSLSALSTSDFFLTSSFGNFFLSVAPSLNSLRLRGCVFSFVPGSFLRPPSPWFLVLPFQDLFSSEFFFENPFFWNIPPRHFFPYLSERFLRRILYVSPFLQTFMPSFSNFLFPSVSGFLWNSAALLHLFQLSHPYSSLVDPN